MGVFRDHFMKSLDEIQPLIKKDTLTTLNMAQLSLTPDIVQKRSESGIGATMRRVMSKLKDCDPSLWSNMKSKAIHPAYFLFRWISVLFTMEFTLPDVIRLWDSILADVSLDLNQVKLDVDSESRERFEFVVEFSVAMLT